MTLLRTGTRWRFSRSHVQITETTTIKICSITAIRTHFNFNKISRSNSNSVVETLFSLWAWSECERPQTTASGTAAALFRPSFYPRLLRSLLQNDNTNRRFFSEQVEEIDKCPRNRNTRDGDVARCKSSSISFGNVYATIFRLPAVSVFRRWMGKSEVLLVTLWGDTCVTSVLSL